MKLKALMLGAAAAATATTAQAADLPVAPEPVDYVRICDAYGARFYYIPGTETCLRVGGRVRTQFIVNDMSDDSAAWGVRTGDGYSWRTQGYLYLDARTATEFGTLRAFTELSGRVENNVESFDFGSTYIQWGGLLAGYKGSQFDHYTGQAFMGVVGRNWSDTTTQQLSYTATFGNGFYVTGSIEDREERDNNAAASGSRIPDFVAAIGVSQGWGAAKLSGAIHQVYPAVTSATGSEDTLGWAVGGSVKFNLPMLSSGSNVFFQGMYADGALSYIGNTAVNDSDGSANTSKGYSLSAGIYHQATSTIGLALDGSYSDIDTATALGGDVTRWAIDGSVQWEPVSGLQLGVDAGYFDQDISGGTDTDGFLMGVRMQRTF